jgi:hypothetical protein
MPKVQVFDPPMCCSTGVCGPEVDPVLVRFAADVEWLKANGAVVERFNLSQEPASFVSNAAVAAAMRQRDDALPLLLLDGKVVAQGSYPAREVLAELVGIALPKSIYTEAVQEKAPKACCPPVDAAPVTVGKLAGAAPKKCC